MFNTFSLTKPTHTKKTRKQVRVPTSHTSGTTSSFPIDFFESCQQSNDVEFGGPDVLHVYNSQQVKHRLNTAGMYIANTKVKFHSPADVIYFLFVFRDDDFFQVLLILVSLLIYLFVLTYYHIKSTVLSF